MDTSAHRLKSGADPENRKRVAMMTWYHSLNYGTTLQASAMYKVIADLGFQPSVIQYRSPGNIFQKMTPWLFCQKGYNWILNRVLGPRTYFSKEMEGLFREFRSSRITETGPVKTEEDFAALNDTFDAFVCGSDQIWTPYGYDDKFYLSFVKDANKRIAYAPSMGQSEIVDPRVKQGMAEQLKGIAHLSIREERGAEIIRELTGREAKVVLDPTLLLRDTEWDEYAGVEAARKLEGAYIFCYFLGNPSKYRSCVKAFGEKYGLPVYEIPAARHYGRYASFPYEVGPSEFLSLIKNAALVFTDSFHGAVFSVVYKTPFVVFERFQNGAADNQNSRIYTLVKRLGLESRLMPPEDICGADELLWFDYTDCYKRLDEKRAESLAYLRDALENAVSLER